MSYLPEIIWLLMWPILIFVSYKIASWTLKFWEEKHAPKKAE